MDTLSIPTTMQALFQSCIYSQDLMLTELPVPKPNFELNDHLIRVHAVAPCAGELLWPSKHQVPNPAAKVLIPCFDVAGTVVIAPPHSQFKVGDEIYTRTDYHRTGCGAEYAIARTQELARKPKSLSWAEAVTVPLSALTAWQALFVQARTCDFTPDTYHGKRVFVTAASGGVGVWIVQLARLAGAEVVGTCGPSNVDLVSSLGATEVIDYTTGDLKAWAAIEGNKVDVAIDCVGKGQEALEDAWWCVKDGGVLISITQPPEEAKPASWDEKTVRNFFFIMEPDGHALTEISKLIEEGKCRPQLDSVWPFEKFKEAFQRLDGGHVRGKIAIEIIAGEA